MHQREIKLLGFGSPLVDILINVGNDFLQKNVEGKKGGMELVDISIIDRILTKTTARKVMVPGGSCANTISTLARLGVKTGFLGKVGTDKLGSFYTKIILIWAEMFQVLRKVATLGPVAVLA